MAVSTCFFILGLLCAARANPLGQTTVCETTPSLIPQYLPTYQTVCETTPNILPYGLPLPLSPLSLPSPLPAVGTTTVCETAPNILPYGLPLPLSPLLPQLPSPLPVGSTTVCETSPNIYGLGNLGVGYPLINPYPVSTTVCDTIPNLYSVSGYVPPYSISQNLVGRFPNVPVVNSLGSSTYCETAPNLLPFNTLPLTYSNLYPGVSVSPLGMNFL